MQQCVIGEGEETMNRLPRAPIPLFPSTLRVRGEERESESPSLERDS